MSATALKSTKRRFSSLNHQNFEFFRLVPRSSTHTGLICGKTLEPNISSLGPFKRALMIVIVKRAFMIFIIKRAFMIVIVKSDTSGPSYHRGESTNRLAMATFWRAFHHDGQFISAWWWCSGGASLSLSFYQTSRAKLWCTLQLKGKGRYTPPISPLYSFLLCSSYQHFNIIRV